MDDYEVSKEIGERVLRIIRGKCVLGRKNIVFRGFEGGVFLVCLRSKKGV